MSNLQFLMHKGELPILWKHKCDKKYSIQIPEQTFMCGLQTGGNNNDMPNWSITKKHLFWKCLPCNLNLLGNNAPCL